MGSKTLSSIGKLLRATLAKADESGSAGRNRKTASYKKGESLAEQSDSLSHLFVPENTVIRGDLTNPGDIVIDGEVVGDVTCRQLTINANACVTGDIKAQVLIIDGTIFGAISSPRVTFRPTCHVEGPVFCDWYDIQKGAYFEGSMKRTSQEPAVHVRTSPESLVYERPRLPVPDRLTLRPMALA